MIYIESEPEIMQQTYEENFSDSLDYLVLCTLDDLAILETPDLNELNEVNENMNDDLENDDDTISLDPDDLKEWFDEKSSLSSSTWEALTNIAEQKTSSSTTTFHDTQSYHATDKDFKLGDKPRNNDSYQEHLKEKALGTMNTSIDYSLKDEEMHCIIFQKRLDSIEKSLDLIMQRSELSSKLLLKKEDSRNASTLVDSTKKNQEKLFPAKQEPQKASSLIDSVEINLETAMRRAQLTSKLFLNKRKPQHVSKLIPLLVTDLISGKRKYLTTAVEESRKNIESLKASYPFIWGKRKNITEKIKESQNRLKILRRQSEILLRDKRTQEMKRFCNLIEATTYVHSKFNI